MKNNLKAFTLIELLVGITITIIIIIWLNSISLTNISEAQKVWIFYNKIRSNIESVTNYSLIWKAIDSNMNIPKYWKVNIDSNSAWVWLWTWQILVSYWSWTFQTHTWFSIKSPKFYAITNIQCSTLQNSKTNSNNIKLLIENWDIKISNCPNTNDKIVEFDIKYKNYKKHLKINSVNNIIN